MKTCIRQTSTLKTTGRRTSAGTCRGVSWTRIRLVPGSSKERARAQKPTPRALVLPSVDAYQYRSSAVRGPQAQVPKVLDPELSGEPQEPALAVLATTRPQTYPRGRPRADLHPKKVNNLGPMAPNSFVPGPVLARFRALEISFCTNMGEDCSQTMNALRRGAHCKLLYAYLKNP